MPPTLEGTLVGDRYRLLARALDRGAGETWRAEDTRRAGAHVSVKFLRAVEGDELPPALLAAVRALKVFRHDAVPAVLAHGLLQRRPWIVFEELAGASAGALLDAARTSGRLVALDVLRGALAAVFDAVRCAHGPPHPLFVGSLTPGAVMVPPKPVRGMGALLLDLGLYGHVDAPDDVDPRSARRLVTDAPELRGGAPTARSDVFALGALCTELLATPPDVGATVGRVSEARRRQDVPPAVWRALSTALATDPAARFPDVGAMWAALDAAWKAPVSPLQQLLMAPAEGAQSLLDSVVILPAAASLAPPSLVPRVATPARAQAAPLQAAPLPVAGPLPPLKPTAPAVMALVTSPAQPAAPSSLARLLAPSPPAPTAGTPWDTNILQGSYAPAETPPPDDGETLVFAPAPPDDGEGATVVATKPPPPAPPAPPVTLPMNDPSGTLVADAGSLRASARSVAPSAPEPPRSPTPPPVAPVVPPAPAPAQTLALVAWAVGGVALLVLALAAFLWARR